MGYHYFFLSKNGQRIRFQGPKCKNPQNFIQIGALLETPVYHFLRIPHLNFFSILRFRHIESILVLVAPQSLKLGCLAINFRLTQMPKHGIRHFKTMRHFLFE
jgi:hypothetical protein